MLHEEITAATRYFQPSHRLAAVRADMTPTHRLFRVALEAGQAQEMRAGPQELQTKVMRVGMALIQPLHGRRAGVEAQAQ
jgi:hypothetical protein